MTDDDIKLLIAVTSDEKKAARLAELQDKLNEIEAAISKLNDTKAANQDLLDQANRAKAAADDEAADVGLRKAELDAREEQMTRVAEGIRNEQQRWETVVRQPTEAAHAQKDTDLKAREDAVSFREKEIAGVKEKLLSDQAEAGKQRVLYSGMIAELTAVLNKQADSLAEE